jgi:hypothetical protein
MRRLVWVVMGLATACSDYHAPTPTTPSRPNASTPGPTPPATVTLSGMVFESTTDARRPLPGAQVFIWVEVPGRGYPFGRVTTDAQGRYAIPGLPHLSYVVLTADGGSALSQPCGAAVRMDGDAEIDVELVLTARPVRRTRGAPTLSGIVYAQTAGGPRPIEGAWV